MIIYLNKRIVWDGCARLPQATIFYSSVNTHIQTDRETQRRRTRREQEQGNSDVKKSSSYRDQTASHSDCAVHSGRDVYLSGLSASRYKLARSEGQLGIQKSIVTCVCLLRFVFCLSCWCHSESSCCLDILLHHLFPFIVVLCY